jgi:glycosyltransferase involved in cell wall biosynthesis
MIKDGEDGLLFPPGEPALLARQIRRVFEGQELGDRISAEARRVARARHDPSTVIGDLIRAYQEEIAGWQR